MSPLLLAALIRAGRTAAQTAIAMIGTTAVLLTDVPWVSVASASVLAGVLALLMAAAGGLPEASPQVGTYVIAEPPATVTYSLGDASASDVNAAIQTAHKHLAD